MLSFDTRQIVTAHIRIISGLFVLLHGALFVHGLFRPEAFMAGDRSQSRWDRIHYVFLGEMPWPDRPLGAGTFGERLLEMGHPGDFAFHGMAFLAAGPLGVVALQLALAGVATLCVYRLGRAIGLPENHALGATLIWMLLPGSLILPHELASEGLFNPLLIIATYLVISSLERGPGLVRLLAGSAVWSLAIMVRPQLLIFPLVLVGMLAVSPIARAKRMAVLALVVCLALPAAWGSFTWVRTGEVGLGSPSHGPGIALFKTTRRMAGIGGFDFDTSAHPDGRMDVATFAGHVRDQPAAFVRLKAAEASVLLFNPGFYSLAGHHLGAIEAERGLWLALRDSGGFVAMVRQLFEIGVVFTVAFGIATVGWALVLVLALVGVVVFIRAPVPHAVSKAILLGLLVYSLGVVMISSAVRWGHRTPIEFVLVLLMAFGFGTARRWAVARWPSDAAEP